MIDSREFSSAVTRKLELARLGEDLHLGFVDGKAIDLIRHNSAGEAKAEGTTE
jgi:hypothetical protein